MKWYTYFLYLQRRRPNSCALYTHGKYERTISMQVTDQYGRKSNLITRNLFIKTCKKLLLSFFSLIYFYISIYLLFTILMHSFCHVYLWESGEDNKWSGQNIISHVYVNSSFTTVIKLPQSWLFCKFKLSSPSCWGLILVQ